MKVNGIPYEVELERNANQLQGTGEWFNARTGKLTASRMRSAMKRLKNGEDSAERKNLKIEILCERMTGDIVDKFVNTAMQWGIEKEPEAKAAYETKTGRLVQDVGFIDHPQIEFCGASPDGFVDDGLIEIKCPTTATHVSWILDGGIPEEHEAQMILQCAVTGRSWVDFVSYDPRMPEAKQLLIRRFYPTAEQIAKIEKEAEQFLQEVDGLFETITRREMIE
jgi:putative phage-type endonuclease